MPLDPCHNVLFQHTPIIVEDTATDMEIIKYIIDNDKPEDAFFTVDIGDIIKRHQEWISKVPKVTPNYVIKRNYDEIVITILKTLDVCFSYENKDIISNIMKYSVPSEQITLSNSMKLPSDIIHCRKKGVTQLTVDNEHEMAIIQELFPEAKILIRICCDAENSNVKFGCDLHEATRLILKVRDYGLKLHGFSLEIDTPCLEMKDYLKRIEICKWLIAFAKSARYNDIQIINLGRFSSICGKALDELAELINSAIENLDPGIRVISEHDIDSSLTLVSCIHFKKEVISNDIREMYYRSRGINLDLHGSVLETVFKPKSKEKLISSIWADSNANLILEKVLLPELYIDDWLVWKNKQNMSDYILNPPKTSLKSFIRRSQWSNFYEILVKKNKSTGGNNNPEEEV